MLKPKAPKTGFVSSVSVWPHDFLSASALRLAAAECGSYLPLCFLYDNFDSDSTVTESLTGLPAFLSRESSGPPKKKMLRRRPSNASEKEQVQKKKVSWIFGHYFALEGTEGLKLKCLNWACINVHFIDCSCEEVFVINLKHWTFALQHYMQLSLCEHLFNTGCLLKLVQTFVVNKPTRTNTQNLKLSTIFML